MIEKSLAYVLRSRFPSDVLYVIDSFIPRPPKKKKQVSPSLQRELCKIQHMKLKGKSDMYLCDLIDFVLD
jgi:hypothetical protein